MIGKQVKRVKTTNKKSGRKTALFPTLALWLGYLDIWISGLLDSTETYSLQER
jgi:hypothetical protein